MSTLTVRVPTEPETGDSTTEALRDRLAVTQQAFGDLLAAAQATIAAADGPYRYDPLSWLRGHLSELGLLPAPGAAPTDFAPVDSGDATWGRR